MTLAQGTPIGDYQIVALLGAGGMGEVYRARDPHLGRDVAIKVLPSSFAADPSRVARFEQEARAAGVLNHPNLLTIFELGTHNGAPFIVSELLEGETLRSRLQGGAIPHRLCIRYAIEIAGGLAAAHAKGVLHRDLKPENIFITADGRVKILDFGLAKLTQADSDERTLAKTQPGVVAGSPAYMSPEQVRGEAIDARSDIFSLGTILYEMLGGQQPFRAGSSVETMNAILTADPPPLPDLNSSLHRALHHCLEKNRELRAQSARDVAYELETVSGFHETVPKRRAWWISAAVIAVGLLLAATLWLMRQRSVPSAAANPIDSLAVLPFANATNDPKSDYLIDGVTDSVINSMSQLPQVKVMSRSTMFKFKGKNIDPQDVGRQLNVRAVVSGRVSELADHLTVQAELVNVADGSQLWGEQYNRKLSDIFAIEDEIARDISQKLRLRLTGVQEQRLTKRYTDDVQAYELYLKGRQLWNKRTPADILKATQYFQQSIDRDPHYALAYAGLADAYALYFEYVHAPPAAAQQKAKAAAMKALEIDPALGEANATLGLLADADWQWDVAEGHFRRAIELNPNYATAYQWYALHLVYLRRIPEALAMIDRAESLDPLSLIFKIDVGISNCIAGDKQRGYAALRDALAIDPNNPAAHLFLGRCLFFNGRQEEGLQELIKADDGFHQTYGDARAALAYALGATGRRAKAESIAHQLAARNAAPVFVAVAYAGFDEAAAVRWLQRGVAEHDGNCVVIDFLPELAHIRQAPAVQELLRKMGLPTA
jgi:eukaryotic-like serine/threonine-protein kinase